MLESQFYIRLVITALFGVIFIFAMINLAKSNPVFDLKEKKIIRNIIASIFLLLSVLSGIASVVCLLNISFPTEMIGQPFSAHMIVRKVGDIQYWGYPTSEQQMAITMLTGFFSMFSIAGYLFCFRKSPSRWQGKTLKVLLILLTYMFYVSSTDWHYFDLPEFMATILYATCIIIMFSIGKRKIDAKTCRKVQSKEFEILEDLSCVGKDNADCESLKEKSTVENAETIKTYHIGNKQIINLFSEKCSLIGHVIIRTFKSTICKKVFIVSGVIAVLIGVVVMYISFKSYPHETFSFEDKWKSAFNIPNQSLARSMIFGKTSEYKVTDDFLVIYKDKFIDICNSTIFYHNLDFYERNSETIYAIKVPLLTTDTEQLKLDLNRIETIDGCYDSEIRRYYKKQEQEILELLYRHSEYYDISEYKENVEYWYDQAAKVYVDDLWITQSIVLYYAQRDNYNKAENTYKLALKHDKKSPELLGRLSYVQFKNHNIIDAEASARNAIKFDETQSHAATTLSMIFASQLDWVQAIKWSKVAIDYDTELPEAYYIYAAGLYNIGDKKIAKEYYNKAHSLDPKNYYAEKYEECGGCPVECIKLEHAFTKEGGEIVTDYGKKLQSSKSRYLSTRMEAHAFRTGRYSFDIKVYENGILTTGDTRVDEGYSYNSTVYIADTGECTLGLGSWGSNIPGTYSAGRYRVEVWYKGELVDYNTFRIE